jgi:YesN/AraC family two-component response regulator
MKNVFEETINTILIVDDEENTRIGLAKLLYQDGYQAEAVANGFEALDYLGKKTVDLVITDINMPGMNGLVFFRELRQAYPNIRVIMITAYCGVGSYLKSMSLGALEYLIKPFKVENLISIILKTIHQTFSLSGSSIIP